MVEIDRMQLSGIMREAFEWDNWRYEIPAISFPASWQIQIVPPYMGAVVRFIAHHNDKEISVYLDCYDIMGFYGEPYWEAYPIDGDNVRFAMKDTAGLIAAMAQEFERKEMQ